LFLVLILSITRKKCFLYKKIVIIVIISIAIIIVNNSNSNSSNNDNNILTYYQNTKVNIHSISNENDTIIQMKTILLLIYQHTKKQWRIRVVITTKAKVKVIANISNY